MKTNELILRIQKGLEDMEELAKKLIEQEALSKPDVSQECQHGGDCSECAMESYSKPLKEKELKWECGRTHTLGSCIHCQPPSPIKGEHCEDAHEVGQCDYHCGTDPSPQPQSEGWEKELDKIIPNGWKDLIEGTEYYDPRMAKIVKKIVKDFIKDLLKSQQCHGGVGYEAGKIDGRKSYQKEIVGATDKILKKYFMHMGDGLFAFDPKEEKSPYFSDNLYQDLEKLEALIKKS